MLAYELLTPQAHTVYSDVEEKGKVARITNSTVEIILEPSAACEKCPVCMYCHPSGNKRTIVAANPGNVEVGDEVTIKIIPRHSLIAVFSFFGLPVFLSLIGLIFGQRHGEMGSLILGTGGFLLGLIVAKIVNDIAGKKGLFYPKINTVVRKTQS